MTTCLLILTFFLDFPRVTVGPENPLRVEKDETAHLACSVDAKPAVLNVKWTRNGRFIDTNFKHTIPRVALKDSGSYTCSADNGLGQVGKSELILDVLHAPIVSLPEKREVKSGENVEIECKVTANPRPTKVHWTKVGDPSFHFTGGVLRLNNVSARQNGRYVCSATNFIQPTGKPRFERIGNATIDINIRHAPGKAFIMPEKPIAVEGRSITLACGANPPGFPKPQYRWWKEGIDTKTLSIASEYTLNSVRLSSAGKYYCQPANDLGQGSVAVVHLDVYQAPKIITELQPKILKRSGDIGFTATCSAVGKPKPRVRWFKDGQEILDSESTMFQIDNSEQENLSTQMAVTVQSTLKFFGPERFEGQQLMSTDRGTYSCQFENEVTRRETKMKLNVEHAPIVVHAHNKVAYNLDEPAYITCRMQAFPEPRFDWSFKNSILQNDRHFYETNTTSLGDDIFESTLKVFKVSEASYGDYTCKAMNEIGPKRTIIKLQPKGKPEKPTNIRPVYTSYNVITLAWDEGFNGGYNSTLFTIQYRRQGDSEPMYLDCRRQNPCNISGLEQHTQYYVRVKASNIHGESKFSPEAAVATKVDVAMIPKPANVHYEKTTKRASFLIENTPLQLVAKIELENSDGTWSHYNGFRMENAFNEMPVSDPVSNLRVRLCLESNELLCGPYAEALIVDVRPNATTSAGGSPWLIGVIVIIILLVLLALLLLARCFCCGKKKTLKNEDVNSNRPTIIHGTQPPPYTTNYGIENKGVDTVKDVSDGDIKAKLYSAQNGDLYHNGQYTTTTTEPGTNSNSNSANGGSVNSQDSLWNVKNSGPETYIANGSANVTYQNGYMAYDAMAMQQQQQQQQLFPGTEDYTHYPYPDEYLNERNRQYLNGSVPQNRQRMDSDCKFANFMALK